MTMLHHIFCQECNKLTVHDNGKCIHSANHPVKQPIKPPDDDELPHTKSE